MINSPIEFLARQYDNVIKYGAKGTPGVFVRFPKMKSSELDASLPDHTHPAFIINGIERDEIFLGKHMAVALETDGALYSLSNMPPRVSLDADAFLARMRDLGNGASGKTVADSGFLLLLAAKNGWTPRGNNRCGIDYRDGTRYAIGSALTVGMVRAFRGWYYRCLIAHTASAELLPCDAPAYWRRLDQIGGTPADPDQYNEENGFNGCNTLTGSGPLSWYLGGAPGGLCDIVGNACEQDYGYRLVNCEIQILENNNAANPDADLSDTSAAWKAILPNQSNDGYTLVAPGTAGTLHWTWADGKITLDTVEPTFDAEYRSTNFKDLAANTDNLPYVPHIMKELGLFPLTGSQTQGNIHLQFTDEERFPRRGGHYDSGAGAGLGSLHASHARADTAVGYGARPRCL